MSDSVGRYKLLFQLGAGGMAEVFLAHEAGTAGVERLVVIKRVLPHLAQDDLFINMLRNEARISTRLNHPNIAHVYEVGEHKGRIFIAMEFVYGVSLRTILRRSGKVRLSRPLAALIAARVAAALHHAHNLTDLQGEPLNVVHRDVSPDNIHISYEGVVKVLDFGIAKARSNVENTMSGVLKGKYTYLSPEQALFEELDHRSDLFPLGIVLHEMLTYKKLFRRKEALQILKEITEGMIPMPSAISEEPVPEELDRIVMTALRRDREQRFASARQMQEALLGFLKQHPATDMDLEAFMTEVFGTPEEHRRQLREACEQHTTYPAVQTPGTPSGSLPTWSGLKQAEPTEPSDSASLVSGESKEVSAVRRRAPAGSRRLALVGLIAVVVLVTAIAIIWKLRPAQVTSPAVSPPLPDKGPAPVAKVPRPGQLIIKSTPGGATIWIDGQQVEGKTPTVVQILGSERALRVSLKLAGHQDLTFPVTLRPGAVKEVQRALVPLPPPDARASLRATRPVRQRAIVRRGFGRLTINSNPWAVVYLDGRRVGVTPLVKLRVTAGRHKLRLRNPDKKLQKTLVITVPKGRSIKRMIAF